MIAQKIPGSPALESADDLPQHHGRFRLRRAFLTSTSSIGARVLNFASVLAIVTLTVHYLGPERYGVWMTILSVTSLLGLTNLGIGNALISIIAQHVATNDPDEVSRYVASATIGLLGVAATLGLILAISFQRIPWDKAFHVSSGVAGDARLATAALLAVLLVSLPAGLVVQIRTGCQEGYVNAWFDGAASVVSVIFVAGAVHARLGLPALVAGVAAIPVVFDLLNWGWLVRQRPGLWPRIHRATVGHLRVLLRSGALFFFLSITFVISFSSDNFIAAQVLGAKAVTAYAVPSRLVIAAIGMVGLLVLPLWPAYADALTRGDVDWVLRTLKRSLQLTVGVAAVGGVVFVVAGAPVVRLWTRGEVSPRWPLIVGLAVWLVLGTLGLAFGTFLNALHIVRPQLFWVSLECVANIVLSVFLTRAFGVSGLIWGTNLAYFCFVVLPYALRVVPRALRSIEVPGLPAQSL